jgi:hypothetical protein
MPGGCQRLDYHAKGRVFEAATLRWDGGGGACIRATSRPLLGAGFGSMTPTSIGSQTQRRSSPSDSDIKIHEFPVSLSNNNGGYVECPAIWNLPRPSGVAAVILYPAPGPPPQGGSWDRDVSCSLGLAIIIGDMSSARPVHALRLCRGLLPRFGALPRLTR